MAAFVDIASALELVIELAHQSLVPEGHPDRDRQAEALAVVEDMAVNWFGDDCEDAGSWMTPDVKSV